MNVLFSFKLTEIEKNFKEKAVTIVKESIIPFVNCLFIEESIIKFLTDIIERNIKSELSYFDLVDVIAGYDNISGRIIVRIWYKKSKWDKSQQFSISVAIR